MITKTEEKHTPTPDQIEKMRVANWLYRFNGPLPTADMERYEQIKAELREAGFPEDSYLCLAPSNGK